MADLDGLLETNAWHIEDSQLLDGHSKNDFEPFESGG